MKPRNYTFRAGKPKKKRKKSERSRLRKELDKLFSLFIRTRDKRRFAGKCAFACGRPLEVAFHFLSRGNLQTRWNTDNAVGSCRGCNFNEVSDRREARKAYWRGWHVAFVGEVRRLELEDIARLTTKWDAADLGLIRTYLAEKLERVVVDTPKAGAGLESAL